MFSSYIHTLYFTCYGKTKLETLVSTRSLKLSNLGQVCTWMGDHSSVEVDAVVKKYCKKPRDVRDGPSKI